MYTMFPCMKCSFSKLNWLYNVILLHPPDDVLITFSLNYLVLRICVGEGTFEGFYYWRKYISCHRPNCSYCSYYQMHKQTVRLNFIITFTNIKLEEKAIRWFFRIFFNLTSCLKCDHKNLICRSLPSGQDTGYVKECIRSSFHCQCKFI